MIEGANTSPFTQIAHIARSQGLKGELKVLFEIDSVEAIEQILVVYLRSDRGDFYPCRIANLRVEGKGNKISFFVQFENIADRTSAEALKNKAVFIETTLAEQLFSGAQVVVTVATNSGSLLIPIVDEFVTEIDHQTKIIRCQNLAVLEDL